MDFALRGFLTQSYLAWNRTRSGPGSDRSISHGFPCSPAIVLDHPPANCLSIKRAKGSCELTQQWLCLRVTKRPSREFREFSRIDHQLFARIRIIRGKVFVSISRWQPELFSDPGQVL